MRKTNYSGLKVVERVSPEAKKAIILFHGYGADCTDLASLAEAVSLDGDTAWFFPDGPHEVVIGPHMSGRAWFPLRLAELQLKGIDFTQAEPPGMSAAVKAASDVVTAISRTHGFSLEQIVIGGFSQGAMVSLGVALQLAERGTPIRGLTLFSGTLVAESYLRERGKFLSGLSFFQSHGTHDLVLPYPLAERLEQVLVEMGMNGMLLPFRGGHEIPLAVLREWESWLTARGYGQT